MLIFFFFTSAAYNLCCLLFNVCFNFLVPTWDPQGEAMVSTTTSALRGGPPLILRWRSTNVSFSKDLEIVICIFSEITSTAHM